MRIYPPRPEEKIDPSLISYFEDKGWIGQIKKNGTCTVIETDSKGVVAFKTRQGEDHKAWSPTSEMTSFFSMFPDSIFVGELLHSKGPSVKNTIYLFDVLKHLGHDLIGATYEHRYQILSSVVPMMSNILITENHTKDLTGLFFSLYDPLDEGIVLKDPEGALEDYHRDNRNIGWQVKSRKATKNYSS